MRADLHMHSTHSDGLKTTEEIFIEVSKTSLDYISITDHDIVKGVEENIKHSKKYGVKYIPGIELSTVEQGKPVHVLGYFTDDSYYSEDMLRYYKEIKEKREIRARKFITNLKEYFDIEITYEDVKRYSKDVIARPHIAKAICEKYPQYNHNYVFDHFIGDHSKAYVPSCELSVSEGIDLLRRNNCIVVLAHPTLLKSHIKEDVLKQDFDGLEARYYQNKPKEEEFYRELAKKRGMFVTGGSDHHGIPNDSKHGALGEMYLDNEDVEVFLKALKK